MDSAVLKINMLGEFSIGSADGKARITDQNNRSKKSLALLEYLITFRNREISQNELLDLLWPEGEADEPVNTLKTLLHRTRASLDALGEGLGKQLIISRRGAYAWNNDINVYIDLEEFESLTQQAFSASIDERLDLLLDAIKLYKGDFLPKSSMEMWAIPISTYYHSLYLKTVHMALDLLSDAARFSEIIDICSTAINIDTFDEKLHLAMIQALTSSGMQQAAKNHYNSVTELYLNKFGINPSPELTALYKEIIRADQSTEMNLHVIRDDLRENERIPGAFYCEYEFFKDIYRLMARMAKRSGAVMQIALMTVMDSGGKPLSRKQMTSAMERLMGIIQLSLRNSDVFTRFSVSQFLIMLPSANISDSDIVLQRISRNFKKEYPHMNILLHYSSLPMEPLE